MSLHPDPLVPTPQGGLRERVLRSVASVVIRTTLVFTPGPTVRLVRRVFAQGGARTAEQLAPLDPRGVASVTDERYGSHGDELLDLHRPEDAEHALPAVVWVHGGGWVGGSKEELAVYLRVLAREGYAVVAPRYSLAPEARYPTPVRQVSDVLAYVESHAERLGIDPERLVLAGDSAGAQIAAQVALAVSTPAYADAVGIAPMVGATQLRGVVLACGPFDLRLLRGSASASARRLVDAVLRAYFGKRRFAADQSFALASVVDHLSGAFPPALVTVGNRDPLRRHSMGLVERLRALGLEPEALFFPDDHEPPLSHEYQFDLGSDAGRLFFERMRGFLARVTA